MRQPRFCPSQVLAGTPATVATESPSITEEIARPRNSRGTSDAAIREATPKYAPCGRPATKRAAITGQ